MTGLTVRPPRLAGTPELIFRWRGSRTPFFPKLLALAFGAAAFGALTTLRIRVTAPQKVSPRRAAVIYLGDDAQGRAMKLRAQEGGPFPSRFEPSQWEGLAKMESEAMDVVRFQPQPYAPALRDLPAENQLRPLELAAKGELVFPKREPTPIPPSDPAKLKLAPALYPLSGITRENLPAALPLFNAHVTAAMSSASWRFLVRLTAEGTVAECVSLEQGGEAGASELETWLHRIQFKPEPAKPVRWIAVGIGFTNQPADGTDAR